MAENEPFIDIKRLIASKNPKLLKWLPGFVIKYLQRILHEQDVNEFLANCKGKKGIEFCDEVVEKFKLTFEITGLENIPTDGGVILACNHPLGGMDAMALVSILKEKRRDIKFIVNDILLNLENLKDMFVGVNKHGGNASESLRKVDELFGSDQLVCVFPAGLVSRKKKGVVEDLEWKKTFVTRSKKHNKTIVPVYLDGKLSNFFYRLANFREKVGIKANIEMLYLVNELYKQKNKKIAIHFGAPIPSSTFDKSKNDKEWAATVKHKVYSNREEN